MKLIKPITITDTGVFARAGTGTYYGSDGYIRSASANVQRMTYNPSNLATAPYLLLEPAATNLITYSVQFAAQPSTTLWTKTNATLDSNAQQSPGYLEPACKMTETAAITSTHQINSESCVIAAGALVTASIYVKSAGRTKITIAVANSAFTAWSMWSVDLATGVTAQYSVSPGAVTQSCVCTIFTSGWARVVLTAAIDATSTTAKIAVQLMNSTTTYYAGDGASGVYLYGPQLERSAYVTSYIPTAGSPGVRGADIAPFVMTSNVPETEHAAWSSATAYAVNNYCILTSTHKIYQCLIANTDNSPDLYLTGATPKWIEISSTNKWKMFDQIWNSQTFTSTSATPIIITLAPGTPANSVALLNVAATTITVSITANSLVIYTKTISMIDDAPAINAYNYLFTGMSLKTDLVLLDLPTGSNNVITITITNALDWAACGVCVIGTAVDIGGTQYGAKAGITDYSTKTIDTFGNALIVKRAYSKRMTATLQIDNYMIDVVGALLARCRATPMVWIGADNTTYTSLIIYGFYKNFDIDISYSSLSLCSIEIEGLT